MGLLELQTTIAAPLEHVYSVAKNIETFASFIPDVESINIVDRDDSTGRVVADWVGLIPEFKQKIRWTEEDIWDDAAHTCNFRQLKGEYKVFEGVWVFEEVEESARSSRRLRNGPRRPSSDRTDHLLCRRRRDHGLV